jgi:hypothetical protein
MLKVSSKSSKAKKDTVENYLAANRVKTTEKREAKNVNRAS